MPSGLTEKEMETIWSLMTCRLWLIT
jgi:hypothetical protein